MEIDLTGIVRFFLNAWNKAEPKDLITFGASMAAIFISTMTYFQRASEAKSGSRKHLTDIIEKLHETNVEQAKWRDKDLRKEFPRDYDRLIGDRRRFLVRQAKYLVEQVPGLVSPYERGLVAMGLESIDDTTEANEWFRAAIKYAHNEFDKLIVLRQYGRFLFRTGRVNEGRKQFNKATNLLCYGSDRNNVYQGDTYERWAQLEYDFGDKNRVAELLDHANIEYRKVSPPDFSKLLLARLKPLQDKIEGEAP